MIKARSFHGVRERRGQGGQVKTVDAGDEDMDDVESEENEEGVSVTKRKKKWTKPLKLSFYAEHQ